MTTDQFDDEIIYCAVHTDRETSLRCNRCERYMCAQCAVNTPVGYRCRECVRQVEDRFYNAEQLDTLKAFAVAAGVALICGVVLGWLGRLALFVAIVLGFPAGALISQWVVNAVNNRKGRNNWQFAVGGVIVGVVLGAFIAGLFSYPSEFSTFYELYNDLSPGEQNRFAMTGGALPPTQIEYALEQVVSLGTIIFTGLAAYAVYLRIKS
jgi:hypothetical protein